ncbi:fungal specific transcription factor domain-containing [Fusarium albosuccineum]|uniref:Fungal specific transcription factor domain-containing n=1 Tax=Fusarium albosuccineum TaxID=1237068 RepID=A0A8H4KEW2_9HYPO|nr:fungal specific transcription factor domain-containing [Fusarium albosuccineum]
MEPLPQDLDTINVGGSVPTGQDDPNNTKRACDQCRMRKVRCDKEFPCSNCRTASRTCTSTGIGHRPKEARQRVLISSQYERKIDQLESRLGNIENLLKILIARGATPDEQLHQLVHTPATGTGESSIGTGGSTGELDSSDEETARGGDSGFISQTAIASEFLANAVQHTSLHDANPSVEAAIGNLRQLVELQERRSISHGPRFPLQKPLPPGGLSKLPMPPIEAVVPLLKAVNSGSATLFAFGMTLVAVADFSNLCRSVYFPTEDFSQAVFAIVNSGLYDLFMEESCLSTDTVQRDKYRMYAKMAQANLETCLAHLPMFMSAKVENVQALLLGTQYAIDVSRPSVAWHLNTIAAQLCQTGGFHRADIATTEPPRTRQIKAIIFWQVYTWDRGLSLRMGRAPVIHDGDITIPRHLDFKGFPLLDTSSVPRFWLETANLQGRMYTELYSPAALAISPLELARRATELANECRSLVAEVEVSQKEAFAYLKEIKSSALVDIFVQGCEVQFLATLTLVYRAVPAPPGSPSRFSDECLETARRTMIAHRESIAMLKYGDYMKSVYVHRNLMLAPFAPFFVLFCHIVESLSGDDLRMLQEFVASLDALRDASETAEKLCRVFQVFCDVAVVYVEAKSQHQQDQIDIPMGNQLDTYLSQLGFMPMEGQTMPQAVNLGSTNTVMQPGPVGGPTPQMDGWFLGSSNIFGLLEEDLAQIDTMGWMPPGSM